MISLTYNDIKNIFKSKDLIDKTALADEILTRIFPTLDLEEFWYYSTKEYEQDLTQSLEWFDALEKQGLSYEVLMNKDFTSQIIHQQLNLRLSYLGVPILLVEINPDVVQITSDQGWSETFATRYLPDYLKDLSKISLAENGLVALPIMAKNYVVRTEKEIVNYHSSLSTIKEAKNIVDLILTFDQPSQFRLIQDIIKLIYPYLSNTIKSSVRRNIRTRFAEILDEPLAELEYNDLEFKAPSITQFIYRVSRQTISFTTKYKDGDLEIQITPNYINIAYKVDGKKIANYVLNILDLDRLVDALIEYHRYWTYEIEDNLLKLFQFWSDTDEEIELSLGLDQEIDLL